MTNERIYEKMLGRVKWYDVTKGYGFICSHGAEYFAHQSNIAMDGYRRLKDGQIVEFSESENSTGKNPVAVDIYVV